MYVYIWITLLCTWKTVSQLYFNKIYTLKKNLVKNQRLWLPSPVQRPPTTYILECWVTSAQPYWPCSELCHGHQCHWQIKGKNGRKAGKKPENRRRACTGERAGSYTVGLDPRDVMYSPPHRPRVSGRHRCQRRHTMSCASPVTEWSRRQIEVGQCSSPTPRSGCLELVYCVVILSITRTHTLHWDWDKKQKEPDGHRKQSQDHLDLSLFLPLVV